MAAIRTTQNSMKLHAIDRHHHCHLAQQDDMTATPISTDNKMFSKENLISYEEQYIRNCRGGWSVF
jgi:hypothetical protein